MNRLSADISIGPVYHEESFTFVHESARAFAKVIEAEIGQAETIESARETFHNACQIALHSYGDHGDRFKLEAFALARFQEWKGRVQKHAEWAREPSNN